MKFLLMLNLCLITLLFNGCKSLDKIYTSGMGYGIFTALAFIVIIAFLFLRLRKK